MNLTWQALHCHEFHGLKLLVAAAYAALRCAKGLEEQLRESLKDLKLMADGSYWEVICLIGAIA